MPRLPTRSADIQPGAISGGRRAGIEDTGVVDLAPLGRTIQSVAENQMQVREESESRKVLVQQAEIRAKYAKRLDEAATSGEELGKIREELDADLSRVTENLQTRKGLETAQMHAANTGAVFDNQANNIAVTRARAEAEVEGSKFLNSMNGILAVQGPSYLPQAEKDIDAFVGTLSRVSPEIRAKIGADLKQNMNVAAAMVQARTNPEAAIKAVESGAFSITPAQTEQVIARAKETQNATRVQEAFLRSEADRVKQEKSDQALDGYFKQIMQGGFSMKAALNDPTLTPRAREHIVLLADRKSKENAGEGKASDPKVLNDLYMRITAPEGTPGKIYSADLIYEATKKGQLSIQHDAYLRNLVGGQKDANNQTLNGRIRSVVSDFGRGLSANLEIQAMAQADKGLPMELSNTFRARVEDKIEELRKGNEPPSQAFDPKSKHFVGSREFTQSVIQEVMGQKRNTAGMPSPKTQEEYNAIPKGTTYVDTDGVTKVKR